MSEWQPIETAPKADANSYFLFSRIEGTRIYWVIRGRLVGGNLYTALGEACTGATHWANDIPSPFDDRQREAPFDEAACRREFEEWARSERMILTVDHPPHYAISEVRHAWYAWLAARRAAPSAGAIPADWQLVPKEPTREMQLAGQQRIPGLHELMRRSVASFAAGGYPDQEQYWYQPWAFAVVAYKAMLAVAPNPPGGHGDGM